MKSPVINKKLWDKQRNKKVWPPHTAGRNTKWCSCFGKTVWQFLRRWNIELIWPSNSTPRCDSQKKWKFKFQRNPYADVHSSMICKSEKWKQPRCPSVDKGINTTWHTHTVQYYSSQKKISSVTGYTTNEPWRCYAKCRSQSQRPDRVWCHLCGMSRAGKSSETDSRPVVARGWGSGEWGVAAKGDGDSVLGDEKCSGIK